jgi:hypothetical protein
MAVNSPKTTRLAITISGAVSLGTFEAGALWEFLNGIKEHNDAVASGTPNINRIEIDVMTGASAGGMSSAIAAQKLAYEASALEGATTNALYDAWVVAASIYKMLPSDAPQYSLLSSKYITEIAQQHILNRYMADGNPSTNSAAHPAAAPSIKLGLALSNLTGVDYTVGFSNANSFTYTDYQDEFKTELGTAGNCDNMGFWISAAAAAVSCGAFPFAFRVQQLERTTSNYPGSAQLPRAANGHFAYTDGGVFQNEPLGLGA